MIHSNNLPGSSESVNNIFAKLINNFDGTFDFKNSFKQSKVPNFKKNCEFFIDYMLFRVQDLTQDQVKNLISYFVEHHDKGKTQTDFLQKLFDYFIA